MRESRRPPLFEREALSLKKDSGLFFVLYAGVLYNKMFVRALLICMQWTDRIRQVKIILVIAAVLIAAASLLVSHDTFTRLVEQ